MGTTDDAAERALASLSEALRAWDGGLAGAVALRQALATLPEVKRRGSDAAEQALLTASSARRGRKGIGAEKMLDNPELGRLLGPFIGDPALGEWPFHDPFGIADEEAIRWLEVLGRWAPVDAAALKMVRVMFLARRRQLWVPASLALARMAGRDAAALAHVQGTWQQAFPDGLPKAWKGTLRGDRGAGVDSHLPRHALHCVAACVANGVSAELLPGFAVERLAGMALPKGDLADGSAVLLALAALVDGPSTRAAVLPHLARRAAETGVDEMQDAVLRSLADTLRSDPAAAAAVSAVEQRLAAPGWAAARGMKRLDALWSWVETGRWCRARGDEATVAGMLGVAAEAEGVLRLALDGTLPGGAASAVEAALPRLRTLLDPHVARTTADAERVAALAELIALLELEALAGLPWRSLVARAVGAEAAVVMQDRTVAEAALADLALHGLSAKEGPALLLRDRCLDPGVVLHLAPTENGFVARQVAVQAERILRQLGTPAGQVRFIWRLLQQRPHVDVFDELLTILRGEAEDRTPLHAVVKAVNDLDDIRRDRERPAELSAGLAALADAVASLLATEAPPPAGGEAAPASYSPVEGIRDVAAVVRSLVDALVLGQAEVDIGRWRGAMRQLLTGRDGQGGGVVGWVQWLASATDGSERGTTTGLERSWRRLDRALEAVASARPTVTPEQSEEAAEAVTAFRREARLLVWPEVTLVGTALERVESWLDACKAESQRSLIVAGELEQHLSAGDEDEIVRLASDQARLDLLGGHDLQRIGRYLLASLSLVSAHRFRLKVSARAQIPAVWAYLAPLLACVAGGPIVVLDVGTTWNETLLPAGSAALAVVVGAGALLVSFGLLAGSVAQSVGRHAGGWGRQLARVCGRTAPTFLLAWAIALLSSFLVLETLDGTSARVVDGAAIPLLPQVLLWSALSLFLGLFLGLVMQGRGIAAEK